MEIMVARIVYVLVVLLGIYIGINYISIVALIAAGSLVGSDYAFIIAGLSVIGTAWAFHRVGRWISNSIQE